MYHFRSTGSSSGMDVIVVKEKACKSGFLPKGVIVPIGEFYADRTLNAFMRDLCRKERLYCAVVRHMPGDKDAIYALTKPYHIVDRFGIFYTKANLFANRAENEDIDIGNGWLIRKNIQNREELAELL